jgi:hypothetical protein
MVMSFRSKEHKNINPREHTTIPQSPQLIHSRLFVFRCCHVFCFLFLYLSSFFSKPALNLNSKIIQVCNGYQSYSSKASRRALYLLSRRICDSFPRVVVIHNIIHSDSQGSRFGDESDKVRLALLHVEAGALIRPISLARSELLRGMRV